MKNDTHKKIVDLHKEKNVANNRSEVNFGKLQKAVEKLRLNSKMGLCGALLLTGVGLTSCEDEVHTKEYKQAEAAVADAEEDLRKAKNYEDAVKEMEEANQELEEAQKRLEDAEVALEKAEKEVAK